MAYFDLPVNSSGAIGARLSSEAMALEQMTGTRLGIVSEVLAMLGLGLLIGIQFSWQLTLITFLMILILFILAFLTITMETKFCTETSIIYGQASSVSNYHIHYLVFNVNFYSYS